MTKNSLPTELVCTILTFSGPQTLKTCELVAKDVRRTLLYGGKHSPWYAACAREVGQQKLEWFVSGLKKPVFKLVYPLMKEHARGVLALENKLNELCEAAYLADCKACPRVNGEDASDYAHALMTLLEQATRVQRDLDDQTIMLLKNSANTLELPQEFM